MKELLLLIILLMALPGMSWGYEQKPAPVLSPSTPSSSRSSDIPQTRLKTIIVDNYFPYTFINKKGLPDGFSVDLIKAVTAAMGIEIDITVGTWDEASKSLQDGQIDLLPMMAYSKERDQMFDFSVPHTIGYDAFFTRKDSHKVRSVEDLRGKTIIVMNKDTAHDYLRSIGMTEQAKLILVDSLPEALRLLAAGKGDAALMPKLVGLLIIKNQGFVNLKQSPALIDVYNRPFSIAVKEGNQALLERLTQGLSIIKATGEYNTIYAKWFGALETPGISLKTVIKYAAVIIGVFAVAGLLLLFWTFSLKKQVAQRTKKLELEITERRQAEEARRESEDKYKLLFDSANDVIFILDEKARILSVNPLAVERLGYTHEEFMSMTINQVDSPEEGLNVPERLSRLAEHDRFTFETVHQCKAGLLIPTEASARRIIWDGQPAIMSICRDITFRKQAEEQLKASLREKEILLKEIQHRVKNNLLTISGVLALQLEQIKDDQSKDAFITSINRVNAMTKIHTRLYKSEDYSLINFEGYIKEIVGVLSRSYEFPPENMIINVKDIFIDIDTAIPTGLILNELVSNAMKHAFPDGRKGEITITMSSEDSRIILTVSDNGIGFPPEIDFKSTESVGLSLLGRLVEQINGTLELIKDKGARFIITFSID